MKTKTHFAFRVDIWDDAGISIVEHVAGVDDFEVAARTIGDQMTHEVAPTIMRRTAMDYDRLAKLAEGATRQSGKEERLTIDANPAAPLSPSLAF
jgi:hypothetical protein